MLRTLTFDKGFRLFNRALALGGQRLSATVAELDVSAGCFAPVTVEYVGRRERFMIKHHEVSPKWYDPTTWESVSVIMICKCRTCEHCLRKRRIHWYHRAKLETQLAPRTWFVSATYNDDTLFQRTVAAERTCRKKGLDWDALSAEERFKHVLRECSRDVTLFLKVLRERCKAPMRYICVAERDSSGERGNMHPHFHLLIHQETVVPITHSHFTGRNMKPRAIPAWRCGFASYKLADDQAPGYVAKYISKDATARVRASGAYGYRSASGLSLASECKAKPERASSDV